MIILKLIQTTNTHTHCIVLGYIYNIIILNNPFFRPFSNDKSMNFILSIEGGKYVLYACKTF